MNEIVGVFGTRGYGKSTKARELVAREARVVVVDPSGDWERRRFGHKVTDLPQLSSSIAKDWRNGFRFVLTPPAGSEATALDRVCNLVLAYQERLYRRKGADDSVIVCDEMAECYSNADAQTRELSGTKRAILRGRHFGVGMVGITQYPQDVAARFRAMCERSYVFALHDQAAIDPIVRRIGREHARTIATLPKFAYLAIHDGRVTREKLARA